MRTLVACVFTAVLCTAATATAATVITGRQIKNNTVTSADIRNGTIRKSDLHRSAQPAPGPTGPQGPAGPQGAKGDPGTVSRGFQRASRSTVPPGQTVNVEVRCPEGNAVAGGGYRTVSNDQYASPVVLVNDFNNDTWQVVVRNDGETNLIAAATANCVPTS